MPNRLVRSLCAILLALALPAAHADVLNFDDLDGTAFFTSNYHGFTFGTNNLADTAWFYSDAASAFYGPHSGAHYIATDFMLGNGLPLEATQSIRSADGSGFVFQGAWFTGIDPIAYDLYAGGVLVYSSTPSDALTGTPSFYASGYDGVVDAVVIRGTQGFYALDDFTFTAAAAVPEPDGLGLLGIGAVGCLVATRRRRSS